MVNFDATASNDPGGTIDSYIWDFGDGSTGSGETTSHEYISAGTYTVTLTVADDDEATDTATGTIVVIPPVQPGGGGGGGCFISAAAFGSPMEPHVKLLGEFRERFLFTNPMGKAFVDIYNTYSPPVADFIARHDTVRALVRWSLLPVVGVSWMTLYFGPLVTITLIMLLVSLVSAGAWVALKRMRLRHQA